MRARLLVQRHQRQVLLQRLCQALQRRQHPSRGRAALRAAAVAALLVLPEAAFAADFPLLNAGFQTRISNADVIGKDAPETFSEHDVTVVARTPWEYALSPSLGAGVRLFGSVGFLEGPDGFAAVATAIPLLAIGTADGRFAIDGGAGLGLLGEHEWAQQDFGGPLQFALTVGMSAPLHRRLGIGYRFMHYSDAGAYSSKTVGADLHMGVVMYRF